MHGVHNTRRALKIWKIVESDLCEKCDSNETEDTYHYFISCPFNKKLLKEIFDFACEYFEITWEIPEIQFIAGIWSILTEKPLKVIDRLIYFGRIFIIQSRRSNKDISIKSFLCFMVEELSIFNRNDDIFKSLLFTNIAWDRIMTSLLS